MLRRASIEYRHVAGPPSALVVVELSGRLGNQLFQFASGLALARRRGAVLAFDTRQVAPEDLLLPELLGDRFRAATDRELLSVGQLGYDLPLRKVWASTLVRAKRLERRWRGRTRPTVMVWDDTGRYRPAVFDVDLPVFLQGHLQSERYFEDIADEVADSLVWPAHVVERNAELQGATAVSYRRGDYNSLGWALPLSYYDCALKLLAERIGGSPLVLFGDDRAFIELVADRLRVDHEVINALDLDPDPISQLAVMVQCEHHVIANSSFAWWGAWLAEHQSVDREHVVVAPSGYGEGNDRLPSRWLTCPTVPMF